ncbi:zinc finger protein OZF-like [Dunckerocampus dactyliophorus]|uniref:zinc finger protein OZF-like n=1 Tax=Dunckerocampus dactyliophorus TaxID=161453 RepID=UPI002404EA2C|nr:zinc finger protein OZF-like [Dunckerocampus dactyliophorus]
MLAAPTGRELKARPFRVVYSLRDPIKMLRELVKERLMAAVDEILALFEKTIASYEEELSRTREENELHRQQLESVYKTHIMLRVEDHQRMIGRQERPPQPQGEPQLPHVKEEEEELWITQEGERPFGLEEADLTTLPLTVVSVKIEDHEDKPQADNLLAPLSDNDDTTSHSPEDEDRGHTREPFSSNTDCRGEGRVCSEKKTGKKQLSCSVCDKSYAKRSTLTGHMRTHTGEHFTCSLCPKSFTQKSHLTRHMRTHTGEKPFSCSVCDKRFSQKVQVIFHMRTHTGEKPFSCSVCGERFSRKESMLSHMRTHTGEKPYSCSVCGKRFSDKTNMGKHTKTHTRQKSFCCSVCGREFARKSNMEFHMSTHAGEKTF